MPTIHFRLKLGGIHSVEGAVGRSLMLTALHANVQGIDAECGGSCSCATCHVLVDPAWYPSLPPPDEVENEMLDFVATGRQPNSRLSCQICITAALDGLTVQVPDRQS